MTIGYRRCCGIDVHKKSLSVCVLPPVGIKGGVIKEETFRTFTRDLKRLRTWLQRLRVTEVAMESTGQYWRPVWNILEGAVEKMLLLNPAHVKGLAGRKTDRQDARWLATRVEREDLKGSFVPPRGTRELRELTRLRVHWLQDLNRVKNRIGDVCEAGNIKVSSVASDLFGLSGRQMLKAVVEGKRDAGWMADYARGSLRGKKAQLELALEGTFSGHQREMLDRLLGQMNHLETKIKELNEEIEQRVRSESDRIQRLCTIPGVDRISAWTILAETGTDMKVFEDARRLASWAGLCPGNKESGGKRLSGKTRKGNVYLRRTLCQCAWAATRKKDSQLAALYHRIRSRRGHQKAIMAVAHQLIIIIFHLLRDGGVYQELGCEYYDQRNKPKTTARLVKRLQRLGYYVTLQPQRVEDGAPGIDPPAWDPLEEARGPIENFADFESSLPPDIESPSETEPVLPRRKRGRPCKCASRGIPCEHLNRPTPGKQILENQSDCGGSINAS